jgi:hypothetical protein
LQTGQRFRVAVGGDGRKALMIVFAGAVDAKRENIFVERVIESCAEFAQMRAVSLQDCAVVALLGE